MEKIFITPGKPGLIVRDPVTGKPLDAAGESKHLSPYWRRRLKAGDVIAATPQTIDTNTTTAKKDKVSK